MENKSAISVDEETLLLAEIDKGIDDMENGRVTPHERSMEIVRQQYKNYVIQNS